MVWVPLPKSRGQGLPDERENEVTITRIQRWWRKVKKDAGAVPAQVTSGASGNRARHGSRPRRHCTQCGTRTRSWSRCHTCDEVFCQRCVIPVQCHDCQLYWANALAAAEGYVAGLESYNHDCLLLIAQHLQGL